VNRTIEKTLRACRKISSIVEAPFDSQYLCTDVPMAKLISHQNWFDYLVKNFNKPGLRILELGSREVTVKSAARKAFFDAEYVGFDYYGGDNVDVVGDAHKFDLIYSAACFEHFAMPWVVAVEIAKLLNVGGFVFVETHFSFRSHERPWHFFQFSDMALRVLFSETLGFECIEAGVSNPMVGRFSSLSDRYLRNEPISGLYCHTEYLGKKIRQVDDFAWSSVDLSKLVGRTKYPAPRDHFSVQKR
jgi:hypothetical protein